MGDQTTFNIIGSCVSRNAFNVAFGKDLKVTGYLQRNFILDLFDPMPEESKITDKEVLEYDSHKFNLRNIRFLVNGDGIDFILSRKGEWLLIDSFYAGAECSELVFPDGHIKYIQSDFVHILKKIFKNNPRYDGFRYRSVRARENFDIRIDEAVDF
ncbi:MAG: DUF6270 domain-containing protein, partial [archaeon]|nr:DUF6270 domain-containing protein [archaeon]